MRSHRLKASGADAIPNGVEFPFDNGSQPQGIYHVRCHLRHQPVTAKLIQHHTDFPDPNILIVRVELRQCFWTERRQSLLLALAVPVLELLRTHRHKPNLAINLDQFSLQSLGFILPNLLGGLKGMTGSFAGGFLIFALTGLTCAAVLGGLSQDWERGFVGRGGLAADTS
jgi:hypothetical protein